MSAFAAFLSPSEAARRLGVSAKALRLYETHGLVRPSRSAAGWRAYGPDELARAARIVALRKLGLGLGQIGPVLGGDAQDLEPTLAAHQAALESRLRELSGMVEGVRGLRVDLAPRPARASDPIVAFDLPWPWGGERFELHVLAPINFITGPLGCGKTRLALRLAETIPGAVFLPMERASDDVAALDADPQLKAKVDQALASLAREGAPRSDALVVLLAALEAEGPPVLVIDMVEQGLDQPAQMAVMTYLRRRGPGARPLFLMTRSNAILDLALVRRDEAILFCPANHSPPMMVEARPGAPGYEAVGSCLASPQVRARTEGMIAWRPEAA